MEEGVENLVNVLVEYQSKLPLDFKDSLVKTYFKANMSHKGLVTAVNIGKRLGLYEFDIERILNNMFDAKLERMAQSNYKGAAEFAFNNGFYYKAVSVCVDAEDYYLALKYNTAIYSNVKDITRKEIEDLDKTNDKLVELVIRDYYKKGKYIEGAEFAENHNYRNSAIQLYELAGEPWRADHLRSKD